MPAWASQGPLKKGLLPHLFHWLKPLRGAFYLLAFDYRLTRKRVNVLFETQLVIRLIVLYLISDILLDLFGVLPN